MTYEGVVIHGPFACGKTRNAKALARAYGLRKIVDGWNVGDEVEADTLYLTHGPAAIPSTGVRAVPFEVAIQAVPRSERVAPAPGAPGR